MRGRILTALLLREFALRIATFSQPRLLGRYFTTPYSLEGSIEAIQDDVGLSALAARSFWEDFQPAQLGIIGGGIN
jgi:hypothetical protein